MIQEACLSLLLLIRDGLHTWAPTLGLMGVVGWAGSRAVLVYARILLEERGRGPR